MLSDACFDFIDATDEAARRLAEAVHWYLAPDAPIPYGEEIDALRRACIRVRDNPRDIEARCDLLRLAAAVMRFHDIPPATDESISRQADMKALVCLLREHDGADDPDVLVADLQRDGAAGEAAASKVAAVLKKLGGSAYDVAVKLITDISSASVKKMLGL